MTWGFRILLLGFVVAFVAIFPSSNTVDCLHISLLLECFSNTVSLIICISIDEMTKLNNSFLSSDRVLLLWWISRAFDPSRSTTSHYKFDYLRQFSMLPKKRLMGCKYVCKYTLCCFSTCREEDILWLHENNRKNVWLLCRIHFCSDLKDALLIFLYVPYGLVFFF